MKRHLERKNKCIIKNVKNLKYNEKELYDMSLEKIKINEINNFDNLNIMEESNIMEEPNIFQEPNIFEEPKIIDEPKIVENVKIFKRSNNIEESNILEVSNIIENAINHNIFENSCNTDDNLDNCKNKNICHICNYSFHNRSNLNRHLKNCNNKKIVNITNNTNNTTNTLNQNIININLNIPRSFDEDWDISKIDKTLRNMLLLSNMKYTKTLEHILDNDTNLNVIINDESKSGIVYINGPEKFKPMSIDDIIDKSMDKLHKQLNSFYSDLKDEKTELLLDNDILNTVKYTNDRKYESFKNNKYINEKVKEFITNIYNNKRHETLKIYELLCTDDEKALLEGY
jgi:hypothetical protein